MRILIVEDDIDLREMLQISLTGNGHHIDAAANGHEAWEIFNRDDYSVIISDWLMPEVDGLELCRRVRAADKLHYTYIILLTALQGKANHMEALHAGVDDFMTKPYDPEQLMARLIVAERIVRLQEHVKRLEGVLPTCMYCKKIRDSDVWVGIEQYITQRTEASFSHGVCPECYESQVKPELNKLRTK
jgi:phosphoserine phosphatase RsbU/P